MSFRRISRKSLPLALVPVLAAASLVLLLPGSSPELQPVPLPRTPPDRVTLEDGRQLRGEVLREGADHVVVRLPDGRQTLLERERIKRVQRGPLAAGHAVRVRLRSGRVVSGRLVAEGPASIDLLLESGTRVALRRADVASIESAR